MLYVAFRKCAHLLSVFVYSTSLSFSILSTGALATAIQDAEVSMGFMICGQFATQGNQKVGTIIIAK